jgi:penicillin G amidase
MDRGAVAPLLFIAWLREFSRQVLFGRFGDAVTDYWDLKPLVMLRVLTERPDWCADSKHPGRETCATRLAASLAAALAGLRRGYGEDMAQWRWGRAHVAEFANPVLGRIPLLRDWVDLTIPTAGGYDTLDRGPSTIRNEQTPFAQRFGAGLRIITDLADPRGSRMIVAPGQSGNPLSGRFADLLRRWRDFGWLVPDRSRPVSTLVLVPAR